MRSACHNKIIVLLASPTNNNSYGIRRSRSHPRCSFNKTVDPDFFCPPPPNKPAPMPALFLLTFSLLTFLLPPSSASASASASGLPRAIGRKRAPGWGWGWNELGSGLGLHLLAWRLLKLPTSTSTNGGGGYPFDVCTAVGVGAGMISLGGEVLDVLDMVIGQRAESREFLGFAYHGNGTREGKNEMVYENVADHSRFT